MTAARLRAAFIAASVAWAVLLGAAPFLASRSHASPLATALIVGVYGIGSLVCHQLPGRSSHWWTVQMPVCARCAGIYFGAACGAVASAFRTAQAVRHNRSHVAQAFSPVKGPTDVVQAFSPVKAPTDVAQGFSPARRARLALTLAVAPTLLTLVYEWTTGDMPSHTIRAAAGVPIGLVVAWLVVAAADNQVN